MISRDLDSEKDRAQRDVRYHDSLQIPGRSRNWRLSDYPSSMRGKRGGLVFWADVVRNGALR